MEGRNSQKYSLYVVDFYKKCTRAVTFLEFLADVRAAAASEEAAEEEVVVVEEEEEVVVVVVEAAAEAVEEEIMCHMATGRGKGKGWEKVAAYVAEISAIGMAAGEAGKVVMSSRSHELMPLVPELLRLWWDAV
jgi:hypothetical protein